MQSSNQEPIIIKTLITDEILPEELPPQNSSFDYEYQEECEMVYQEELKAYQEDCKKWEQAYVLSENREYWYQKEEIERVEADNSNDPMADFFMRYYFYHDDFCEDDSDDMPTWRDPDEFTEEAYWETLYTDSDDEYDKPYEVDCHDDDICYYYWEDDCEDEETILIEEAWDRKIYGARHL